MKNRLDEKMKSVDEETVIAGEQIFYQYPLEVEVVFKDEETIMAEPIFEA